MKFLVKQNLPTYSFHKHWQFCIGADHAAQALRMDYIRHLKYVHDELGIQYVRFHGIFNDDMHTITTIRDLFPIKGGERFKELTFHKCGQAYDNVLSVGMKPFVELGFMPKALTSNKEGGLIFYGSNFNQPNDYNEWAEYIKAFIRYLLHRYGEDEISSWYFEVWNEPDLQGAFFNGTKQEYFKLYEITAGAIKEVCSRLRVGGPSTSGSKWIKSFIQFCKSNNIPVDFVSTHQYAGDPLAGIEDQGGPENEATDMKEAFGKMMEMNIFASMPDGSCLDALRHMIPDKSEMEEIPRDVFRKNSKIVKEQAEGLPVFYTEWNCNAIFSAFTNDTRKVAAYDVKAALDVEKNMTGSSIWCHSDIFEEMHQFPEEFHGGFGIQTLNGIPKPVFYALKMLSKTGDERIDLGEDATDGEIGIAAFRSTSETQVFLFRQKMKNLDLPKEKADIKVEILNAPRKVVMERIDEDHCNPLKIWEGQGCPADLNSKEVADIIRQSTMIEEELNYTYEDGCVAFNVELGVNDIYFIHIVNE
ncbi:MAG TPA: hypothetical protein VN258_16950 [Mobilitalea sp.]|nr:hypothetical protein [Mobilitalea sp.]